MIQKKVCMLGTFAVGKTSLVSRFVKSIFSEKYHTTVGVKIDKKSVTVGDEEVVLLLWDIHGEDEFQKIRVSYLRGTAGYLLVADGTRRATLDAAEELHRSLGAITGEVPFILLVNKADLADEWETDRGALDALAARGWTVIKTSAKTGLGVEEAFATLARRMLEA
ncbi:MAG TPA: Rab family GTPase [Blastocatellia bacterium]|nr:Rab family GTPase [Blastocatellia bacterium]